MSGARWQFACSTSQYAAVRHDGGDKVTQIKIRWHDVKGEDQLGTLFHLMAARYRCSTRFQSIRLSMKLQHVWAGHEVRGTAGCMSTIAASGKRKQLSWSQRRQHDISASMEAARDHTVRRHRRDPLGNEVGAAVLHIQVIRVLPAVGTGRAQAQQNQVGSRQTVSAAAERVLNMHS